jgi:hypothetical protein
LSRHRVPQSREAEAPKEQPAPSVAAARRPSLMRPA